MTTPAGGTAGAVNPVTGLPRLRPGELQAQVLGILAANPAKALNDGDIARQLHGRSTGAVGRACCAACASRRCRCCCTGRPAPARPLIEAAFGDDLCTVPGDGDTTVGDYVPTRHRGYEFVPGPLPRAMEAPSIHRPHIHDLHITRGAVNVIAARGTHLHQLREYYGHHDDRYRASMAGWHRHLAGLFRMGLGADTRISVDEPMSLFVATSSGFVYAIIWHPERHRCTGTGRTATISDDGTAHRYRRDDTATDHDHIPTSPARTGTRAVDRPLLNQSPYRRSPTPQAVLGNLFWYQCTNRRPR